MRVLVGPVPASWACAAVEAGGGSVVGPGQCAEGLVWLTAGPEGLADLLDAEPNLRWAQLPMAGVEKLLEAGIFQTGSGARLQWACAKGAFSRPVAEHALALALAGLRHLPERARASSWGEGQGTSLYGAPVTILGAGGITTELVKLLAPFETEITVVRRQGDAFPGAHRTLPSSLLNGALPNALVVFIALALVPSTVHVISAPELTAMAPQAWLVNVGRGRHVDTPALVTALRERSIGGAALDVTDPEPLPAGHPLWSLPNCLVTPHTANTEAMAQPLLAGRIRQNVALSLAGRPLVGRVDPVAGY